jgi:hypothetical protein
MLPGPTVERIASRLSEKSKTPFDKLRVSGRSHLKSDPEPLRLSSLKHVLSEAEGPRFGLFRQSLLRV